MKLLTTLALLGLIASAAAAEDLNPPTWRGLEGTTMQAWEFYTNANPATPEIDNNPYGVPSAEIIDALPLVHHKDSYWQRDGVWRVDEMLVLSIPNTQNTGPETWKEIIFQITYNGAGWEPYMALDPAETSMDMIDQVVLDENWTHETYRMVLQPNPTSEDIYVMPTFCTLYVDEIVVDTRCVPEPASLSVLGAGALLLLRRKK